MERFKVGTNIKVVNTGKSYSSFYRDSWTHPVREYIIRYNPCNGFIKPSGWVEIRSGYDTERDLALRTDLKWKIRYYIGQNYNKSVYIVSSNLNHMLVISSEGIVSNISKNHEET